jgi:5-methylthioadenosine/S-adenosylhomocysteine deaminase
MASELKRLQQTPKSKVQGFLGAHFMDSRGELGAEALVIREGRIADLGRATDLKAKHPEAEWFDAAGYVIHPGFINGHTHVAMSFMRDMAHVSSNMLEDVFFPLENKLTPEQVEIFSYPSIAMGLKSGVTCFVDHYYYAEAVGRALESFGARAVLAETINDLGGAMPGPERLKTAEDLLSHWPFSERVTPALGPHAMDTVSDDVAHKVRELQKHYDVPLHMHLSQTQMELGRVQSSYGLTPVERALKMGLLSHKTLAVHLITASLKDWKILADNGVWAGVCPSSQIFYEKLVDLRAMESAGVKPILGTDCAASHDSMDQWTELRTFHLMRRQAMDFPVSVEATLKSLWDHPAEWAGLKVGRLEAGYWADLGFTKLSWETAPVHDLRTHFVLSLSSRSLQHLMIAGRWVLWRQELIHNSSSNWGKAFQKALKDLEPHWGGRKILLPVLD